MYVCMYVQCSYYTQGENGIAVKLGTEGNVALTQATEEVHIST